MLYNDQGYTDIKYNIFKKLILYYIDTVLWF